MFTHCRGFALSLHLFAIGVLVLYIEAECT